MPNLRVTSGLLHRLPRHRPAAWLFLACLILAAGSAAATPRPLECRAGDHRGEFRGRLDVGHGRTELTGWVDGDAFIQRYFGDLRLCMTRHGDVVLSEDATSVVTVGAGSWLVLESEGPTLRRLVVTPGRHGLEERWSIDGRELPLDAEARQWRDAMLTVLGTYWEAGNLQLGEDGPTTDPSVVARAQALEEGVHGTEARLVEMAGRRP